MPARLTNKTAIITGSSSGIGRAIALLFASEGASIICSDITPTCRPESPEATSTTSALLPTHEEIAAQGGTAIYVHCNTTLSSDVEALVAKAVETYGRVDIMVNNAGITMEMGEHGSRPVWEYEEEAFDRNIAVNLKGVFLGTKFAARQMKAQEPGAGGDRGWIVNMASVYGLGGGPGIVGYVSSKHAVLGLTKTAAWDCAPHRIHVNALCPGFTQTALISGMLAPGAESVRERVAGMHPFKGLGTPGDVARAALFLASEDAAWVTGIGVPVDGGYASM